MCGFIWAKLPQRPTDEQISSSAKFIASRGPSSSSFDVRQDKDSYIYSAHFLLDVSGAAAKQPAHFPDPSSAELSLLFNGEIYNYKDLQPGASSDTEALLPLFSRFGAELWARLDGEYAIVIHDRKQNRLHIAADQFLTKPIAIAFDAETGAIGVASYPSALEALGFKSSGYFQPNAYAEFDLDVPLAWADALRSAKEKSAYHYDLEQFDTTFLNWEKAFLQSVKKRATHGTLPIFVPLSSGYDSGAICLALNLLGLPYSTITINSSENDEVIARRIRINKKGGCVKAIQRRPLSPRQRQAIKHSIARDCEPLKYFHADETLLSDGGALGAYHVAEIAKKNGTYVCLSGCGADEIISDYGYNGTKIYDHSEFGGLYPDDLRGFFPWKKVYGDTMRSYLFKDEYIFGVFGIEGRYPFLDPAVVQAFLSLTPALKNSRYKAPIASFLERHGYPFEPDVKRGFSPSDHRIDESLAGRLREKIDLIRQYVPGFRDRM